MGNSRKQNQNNKILNNMKLKNSVGLLAVAAIGVICICGCESSEHEHAHHDSNSVVAKAKLSKAQAEQIAMTQVPGGKIKEGELEMENGILLWSFDVAMQGSKNITEVNINAVSGKIVAVDVETPEAQAKEAKEDPKGKKEKDDDDDKK
jgi:uncharacterized membrane protein YkoI